MMFRRAVALALCATALLSSLSGPASGSALDRAESTRRHLGHRIHGLRIEMRRDERKLLGRAGQLWLVAGAIPPRRPDSLLRTWHVQQRRLSWEIKKVQRRLLVLTRRARRRIRSLASQRDRVIAWIARYGVLRTCPVRGAVVVSDDFGVIVRKPNVPPHVHLGNDISAPTGTPVVAPFAGTAYAVPNKLGGLAVAVYGKDGYMYGAHLSAYGNLGVVHTGTVIGYVGSTGDASGSHLHFEWHPSDGAAVDPHAFLMAVC
ncbi:MAG: M23 family metallopeptidase [Actinobacteria bacterium]|nr:M23 family metallopeptidase [Actinomycetota bacterium]